MNTIKNPLRFYVYAYLRSKDSATGKKGTPYYIGKGQRDRAFSKNHKKTQVPKDKSNIIFISTELSEEDAFILEIQLIELYGRKDLGTGILSNRTFGGDGVSGMVHTKEWKETHSAAMSGVGHPMYGKSQTPDTCKKISATLTGKVRTIDSRNKQSASTLGKVKSDTTREKMRKPKSEEHRENMKKPKPIVMCPHCNISGGANLMSRYHFDKCKQKANQDITKN